MSILARSNALLAAGHPCRSREGTERHRKGRSRGWERPSRKTPCLDTPTQRQALLVGCRVQPVSVIAEHERHVRGMGQRELGPDLIATLFPRREVETVLSDPKAFPGPRSPDFRSRLWPTNGSQPGALRSPLQRRAAAASGRMPGEYTRPVTVHPQRPRQKPRSGLMNRGGPRPTAVRTGTGLASPAGACSPQIPPGPSRPGPQSPTSPLSRRWNHSCRTSDPLPCPPDPARSGNRSRHHSRPESRACSYPGS
jgi:hypothetical protein